VKTVALFGGSYLLWRYRRKLSPILVTYGTFALLVVFFSGSIISNDRYAYAIVSLAIAAGLFLARHAQLSIPLLLWAVMTLICFTIRFAQNTWVA
jgi:hypothetical protein